MSAEDLLQERLERLEAGAPLQDCLAGLGKEEAEVLKLAKGLRSTGFTVLVDLSGRSMKKCLRAASDLSAIYTIFIGSEELERGAAAIKNMRTGFQESVQFDRIAEYLKKEREAGREQ